jgi:hypothetical protein
VNIVANEFATPVGVSEEETDDRENSSEYLHRDVPS